MNRLWIVHVVHVQMMKHLHSEAKFFYSGPNGLKKAQLIVKRFVLVGLGTLLRPCLKSYQLLIRIGTTSDSDNQEKNANIKDLTSTNQHGTCLHGTQVMALSSFFYQSWRWFLNGSTHENLCTFWSWSYFHPCGILIWSVHAFMIAASLMENCTPPLKCVFLWLFFNLIEVSPAILENKRDQSEEPVGPTLTNHHPAWNTLPVTPFPAPTSLSCLLQILTRTIPNATVPPSPLPSIPPHLPSPPHSLGIVLSTSSSRPIRDFG